MYDAPAKLSVGALKHWIQAPIAIACGMERLGVIVTCSAWGAEGREFESLRSDHSLIAYG